MNRCSRSVLTLAAAAVSALMLTPALHSQQGANEVLCDVAYENCRDGWTDLQGVAHDGVIDLIRKETKGIDWSFWIAEDARYTNEIIKRFQAGVPVRIIMDLRANVNSPANKQNLATLAAARIPMRYKSTGDVAHMKSMLFASQNYVEFSGANYNPFEYTYEVPWVNYEQESIYFTGDPSVVNSFKTRFDDVWTNTTDYKDYTAYSPPLTIAHTRTYGPAGPIAPELNFPPEDSYADRLLPLMDNEQEKLHVVMFRLTDSRQPDAMIRAHQRGVDTKAIIEQQEYRNPARIDDSYNVDRMYKAGVSIRIRGHQGLNHQKSIVFGPTQGIAELGSSNWSTASDDNQLEANYFANYHTNPAKLWFYQWFDAQFDRMWSNTQRLPDGTFAQETAPFVPLPPDKPVNVSPADKATDVTTSTTLTWNGGPWARIYDVYLGSTPDPPLFKKGLNLGPSVSASNNKKLSVTALTPGTVYYWKIVSWTMADLSATGPIWSFKTAGTAPPPTTCNDPTATNFGGPLPCTYPPAPKGTIVLRAADITPANVNGNWQEVADTSADGGEALWNPNGNQGKIAPALASPANYFEATFTAPANTPFHLWVRMKAESDSFSNDSVHVQFSDSVTSGNAPTMQIGTTSSAEVLLQNGPTGPALHGWGWTDNGWGSPGANIYFQNSGTHTVRVQQREDGPFMDQIVLSSDAFLTSAPGPRQDDTTLLPPSSSPGSGGPPPPPPPAGTEVVLRTAGVKTTDIHGAWQQVADTSAADGMAIWNPDAGAAKVAPALPGPVNYFEMTFAATPGVPYHMWLRMRAQNDSTSNDSVHMQFTDAVACGTSSPTMQIGTTGSAEFVLQQGPSGPAGHGWGWTDNGWGSPGSNVCFVTNGTTGDTHRLRIQQREDGPFLDQIVLSPKTYLTTRPGLTRDDTTIVPVPGASPTPPPPPWTEQDIGAVGQAGSTTYLAPTFTVNGSGNDIGGSADAFHFVSQPITGDITIQARVTGLNGGGASAAAGVMIRSGLSPGAAEASVTIPSTGGVVFRRRTTDGASTATTAGSSSIPPRWLRVERIGTTLTGYESADGSTWTKIASDTVAVGSSVSVGLAVTGGGTSLASATFDNVSTSVPALPPPPDSSIVLWTSQVDASSIHGAWQPIADATAAGGGALQNPDAGRAKIAPALASPTNYFEAYFKAAPNTPYHLWLRMRAQGDSSSNDSVHVQFSDAVACGGTSPIMQIGTTASAEVVLQDGPSGAPDHGWGWADNGWGSLGGNICFAGDGTRTLTVRIQQREDGAIIDQIVLSPDTYLSKAPGTRQNDTVILPAKGAAPPPPPPPPPSTATVVLWASQVAPADSHGAWQPVSDSTASGGSALQNPDTGAAKVAPALASPVNYFEARFNASPNTPYHLWVRLRAQNNSLSNDSVHLQFNNAVVCGTTTPTMAIGTSSSAEFVLQDGPSGAPDHGWGWTENGWGSLGPNVCFVSDPNPSVGDVHTVRVQQREDGAIVDEIVISPDAFLTKSPGTRLDDTVILAANGGVGTSTSAALVRQPYIQQATSTSAVVVWAARDAEPASILVSNGGTTTTYNATTTYFPATVTGMAFDYYQYEAHADGLAPSTTYSYQLAMGGQNVTDGADHLSTAPPPGTGAVTFVAFGDSGTGSPEQAALATAISHDTFDIALLTGDIVYGSTQGIGAAGYQQYQSWFFDVYQPWLRTHAVFPTIGNHDDATAHAQAYRDLFVLPGNGASSAFPDNAERFYSFDYGPVHFVSLDTETAFLDLSRRQAQLDWLSADLAATTQPWKIVFFHRPPFSSGTEHGSDLDIRAAFGPLFQQHGVQLVLNGHDHDFERTVPIDAAGTAGGPTTYIVTGGGGAPLYAVGSSTWTAVAQSVHHYLRVAVADACRLSVDAVTADGSVVDSSAIDRCAATTTQQ